MNILEVEQGSKAWLDARKYKFTSSELHKLFKGGKRSMTEAELAAKEKGDRRTTVDTIFGDGALTYIRRKVTASLTSGLSEEYHYFESKSTDWGTEYEPIARERFIEDTGLMVETCGFYEYSEIFGGSPDGIVEKEAVLEIKCPADSANHTLNLACQTPQDLKELSPDYYIQIQANMLATGLQKGYFVSYDWRFALPELQIKILEIPTDYEVQSEILFRLDAAAGEMNELLEKITGV
jgi:hypothetical protein